MVAPWTEWDANDLKGEAVIYGGRKSGGEAADEADHQQCKLFHVDTA